MSLTEKYDYITLIGVFEYSEGYIGTHQPLCGNASPHIQTSGKRRKAGHCHRKSSGTEILGWLYRRPCREYFEGIENYPDTKGVRTFSRKELQELIDAAGSFQTTFYYPYPDYKFPLTIYSDKRLPKREN